MKQPLIIVLTLILVVSLASAACEGHSDSLAEQNRSNPTGGQQTRYVANTGADEQNNCLYSENPCATISHAVQVASARDPIVVGAGTYDELLRLNNSLTLQLAGANYDRNGHFEQNLNNATGLQFRKNLPAFFLAGLLVILFLVEINRRFRSARDEKTGMKRLAGSAKIPNPSGIEETSEEEDFMEKLNKSLEKHISDERFNVGMLAVEMNMSTRNLRRKTRSITGESPVAILRRYRLERARQMLSRNTDNISQIAYQCGFSDPGYFSRCFRLEYGTLPSQYKAA